MNFKRIAKSIISYESPIYKSRLVYNIQRWRQRGNAKPDFDSCEYPEILKEIDQNGFIIIKDFISPEDAKKILTEVEVPYNKILEGEKNKDYWHVENGNGRLGNIDKYSETAKKCLYDNKMIANIAKCYVSKDALGFRKEADFKIEIGEDFQANLVHIDDWRHRFKAFLLLHDLERENAPLVFYSKSHRGGKWRKKIEYSYHSDGANGRFGHLFPQEMRKILKEEDYQKIYFEGKAGALFLGDFRGLHSGSPLLKGSRFMLNYTWGLLSNS